LQLQRHLTSRHGRIAKSNAAALTHHGCQPLPPRSAMPSADPCPLAADGTLRVRTLVFPGWAGATGQP
jgi:hypothetical protein